MTDAHFSIAIQQLANVDKTPNVDESCPQYEC